VIEPGQICRDRTRTTFKIAIVLGPSIKGGKLHVCRWQASTNPAVVDGHWSPPVALFEHLLAPLPDDFDLTSRRGQVVAAAKRSVVDSKVRWQVGPIGFGDRLVEIHVVGTVRP
jgi:hypothetical protein